MSDALKQQASQFPPVPGVYVMKDTAERVIYVGKAKDLKKRVSSYFTSRRDLKTRMLVSKISFMEYIVTGNEYEALLLENNLIKKWKPYYNINLKDGKSYPVIRITNEDFPRVFKTRRVVQDGSEYFGPFADVTKVDLYLELIEKLYPLRKCRGKLRKRHTPCLYYHIGRCSAPCAGKVSREEYLKTVEQVRSLLRGNTRDLRSSLKQQMEEASRALQFESAARLRDALIAIESSHTSQQVEDFQLNTRDYIGCVMEEQVLSISVFQMREGKLIGRELHRGESFSDEAEALETFVGQYYREAEDIPEVIYLSHGEQPEMLEVMLSSMAGRKREVRIPQRGKHLRVMKMVLQNAEMDARKRIRAKGNIPAMQELQRLLSLDDLPRYIEGFDIAQLSGTHPTASLVVFREGRPEKQEYRRYHVKTLGGTIDDYESLREVTARRYTRLTNEEQPLPDLVLIDGGTGQVNAVREILDALGLRHLPVIGLAKEFEEIHLPGPKRPLRLPQDSPALKLLQAIRDETHRVATGFNTKLRSKDISFGLLESVPGIGPVRSARLMQVFGSLQGIREAGGAEIAARAGVPEEVAEVLVHYLKEQQQD